MRFHIRQKQTGLFATFKWNYTEAKRKGGGLYCSAGTLLFDKSNNYKSSDRATPTAFAIAWAQENSKQTFAKKVKQPKVSESNKNCI